MSFSKDMGQLLRDLASEIEDDEKYDALPSVNRALAAIKIFGETIAQLAEAADKDLQSRPETGP